jgi:hypothetical protein
MKRILLFLPLIATLDGQSSLPMQFRSGAAVIAVNGTIAFPETAVSATSAMTLAVTNTSSDSWRITSTSTVGAGFGASSGVVTLGAGEVRGVTLTVTPRQPGIVTGVLTLQFAGPANQTVSASFNLAATAGSSAVVLSGAIGSATPSAIASGSALRFAAQLIGSRETASFVLSNQTSAAVSLSDLALSGDGFTLVGTPATPAQIGPGGEVRFSVAFMPTEVRPYAGQLAITAGGALRIVELGGEGVTSNFVYQLLTATASRPLNPEDPIQFNPLASGVGRQNLAVRVTNTGAAEGRIGVVAVTGSYFALADVPLLPATLKKGESVTFTIVFAPTEIGQFEGRLRVDGAFFLLSGAGTGEKLVTALIAGDSRTVLGGPVIGFLPNTVVGEKLVFQVEISNQGTDVSNLIALQVSGDGYATGALPPLPVRLAPGQAFRFSATFAPYFVGTMSGVLQVQDKTYPIRAVGAAPPELPAVQFNGFGATGAPLQQPAIAIELARAYPYALTGRLLVTFASDAYLDDPAIQFLNGARSIDFRIPAGATKATFGVAASDIRLQTGSLAGAITLSASFYLNTFEITKGNPVSATMTMPASPPVVRSAKTGARSTASFELVIAGAANTRSVTKLEFEFMPKGATANQASTKLSADVEKPFDSWFQSAASRGFGGQFSATIRFDLKGSLSSFDSVNVTAVNAQGRSAVKTLKLSE